MATHEVTAKERKMNAAISVESLSFKYATVPVLSDFSVNIEKGKLTCLLGSNGAGKTTLINLILGRLPAANGSIQLFGGQPIDQIKSRVGAMLQNSVAPEKARVRELIELFSSYYPQPYKVQALMDELLLTPIANKRFGKLSGGQKQLVLFALALCGDPDILFLDEPTVGMDVEVRRTLWGIIEALKARGKTIVLTTHYLAEADLLADRIVVLQAGKIVADGTPELIKSQFQSKCIKAQTTKLKDWLEALPEVISVAAVGKYFEVISSQPEVTLQRWLIEDASLSDLTVTAADLEQAFLQLTATENKGGLQ